MTAKHVLVKLLTLGWNKKKIGNAPAVSQVASCPSIPVKFEGPDALCNEKLPAHATATPTQAHKYIRRKR